MLPIDVEKELQRLGTEGKAFHTFFLMLPMRMMALAKMMES